MDHFFLQEQFGEMLFTYPNLYSYFAEVLPSDAKIVEVGCFKGRSIAYLAVEIINRQKNIKIDAVDTWAGAPGDPELVDIPLQINDELYALFLTNIQPVRHMVNPIRLASTDAAKLYQDNSIDAVFIDACHSYECVRDDIAAWLPKVKHGGLLAGHDYSWMPEVKKAVDEALTPIQEGEGCFLYIKPY